MEKIPTYKVTHEGPEEGLQQVAFTDNPAIMIKGVCLSKQAPVAARYEFAEGEKMIVAGPALIPDMKIYRKDDDGEFDVVFTQEEIYSLVNDYKKENTNAKFNIEHTDNQAPAFLFQDWIVQDPNNDTSNQYGFVGETALPKGTWFIMTQVTDKKFWQEQVKEKEKYGFSIEGFLGLKLNRQKMDKKKFANALIEDGTKVYAESFEVGKELYIIDENGDKAPIFDGEHKLDDGTVAVTVDGKITEIKPKQDEMAEEVKKEETPVEVKAAEVPVEEVKKEETVEVKAAEVPAVAPGLTEDAVLALIQPKLDEIYKVIAELKAGVLGEEIAEGEKEVEVVDAFAAKLARIRSVRDSLVK